MHYDPLNAPPSDSSRPARFVNVRHPPIFNTKLTPLEWSDSRKRPRPDGPAPSPDGASAHHKRPPLMSSTTSAPSHADGTSQAAADRSQQQQQQQQQQHAQQSSSSSHQHASHTQHHGQHAPPPAQPPPRVETREVVRVVEKVVPAEPVTVLGCPPLVDDRVRHVVNFMLQHVTAPNVEVEAKLGRLFEKNEGVRAVELVPVMCETPINHATNGDVRFESDVGEELFYRINEELNKRVEATTDAAAEGGGGAVRYFRTKEVDVIYPGRVRETRAIRKGPDGSERQERIRVQRKTRLGDMNMLCPGRMCDVRYSASMEEDCPLDESLRPELQRVKDRISYKYECLSIDITCVDSQGSRDPSAGKTHEVEVEIDASAASLYEEVVKYQNKDESSKLFDIASHLVNTVRILLEQ